MKKFTTLKEDLIKENAQVQEKFDAEMYQALMNIEKIKIGLDNMKKEYLNNPGNWGFVGSLQHVNDLLIDIIDNLP